ncbi:cytochrome P450 [Aspergillus pseudonomiae]|uniref:Cytochrome P450 n=1 Tax=Aspergillus pseudonomiae TaxID=1506151 RepID=A0A5N7CXN7_9EURO|nr:cytochrome P450 [Aspergillus pseudonomiae]KAE8398931.1 cytochrome P450 [Aspergillus pseudonomiae]
MIVSQTENVGLETTHQQPHIVTAVGEDEDYLKWKPAREELLILACLAIVSLVVALDATILVPVLPTIASDLHGDTNESFWVGTAYLLSCAVFQPLFVALSTVFGRQSILFLSLVLFTAGTLICCLSHGMTQLLVGRTVQGVGGAGILCLTFVITTDIIPLRQRPAYSSIIQVAFVVGTVTGPVIGGLLIDHSTWRWVFYLNFPFMGVGLIMVPWVVNLRRPRQDGLTQQLRSIDWVGALLFIASVSSFLIGITWGGGQFPWSSWRTLLPIFLGVAGVIVTVFWLWKGARKPFLRLSLFQDVSSGMIYLCAVLQGLLFSDYGKGDFVHKLLGNLGEGLLVTVDGADWRAKRKELRPHLSTLSEKDREITELHLHPLLERLSQSQAPIDVFDVIDKLQLDIAIHRFVGQLTDADEAGYQRFRKAKRTLAAAGTMRPFLGPLGFLVKPIERTARGDLDIYVQKLLQAADHSIFAKSEAEIEHRRELLLNLILAGKDPTVVTITWAIYELSRNPDVLKKLRLEIADIIGYEQLPSLSSLDRMPYLNNVIRETLRLYPPTGFNFREALRNTTLPRGGGADGREPVAVKKGQVVVFSSFGLQRRPEYVGPDANYWRPERWEHWTPPEGSYIPWGTGPRTCLGKAFGQFQVAYTLVRLFQEFDSVAEVNHGKNTEQRIRLEVLAKPAMTISCRFNHGDQLR